MNMTAQALLHIFSTLPSYIGELFLSVRFTSKDKILILYSDQLGNQTLVSEFDVEDVNTTLMVLDLSQEFTEQQIREACQKDKFKAENHRSDFERIARDIDLIFDTLPSMIVSSKEAGGKIKLSGKGKPFDLRVDVDASVGRASWLVQYIFTDADALVMSFTVDGKDDDVSYWHEHILTKTNLMWGFKHNFGLAISGTNAKPERPIFQVSFLNPTPVPNRHQSWMAQSLGISGERSRELSCIANDFRNKQDMSDIDAAYNAAYEHITSHCRNANELFFIGWACGKGL